MASGPLLPPRATIDLDALARQVNVSWNGAQKLLVTAAKDPNNHTIACSAGVRSGKTFFLSMLALSVAIAPTPYPATAAITIWIISDSHAHADTAWSQFVALAKAHYPELVQSVRTVDGVCQMMNLAGANVLVARKSSDKAHSLISTAVDLAIVDEAALVDDASFNDILGRLVDRAGRLILCSSPRGCSGFFAETYRRGARGAAGIASVTAASHQNENLKPSELAKMRMRMTDVMYRQDVLGEFVAHAGKVFDPNSIEACATGELEKSEPGAVYVAGWDVASSNDYSVLCIGKRLEAGGLKLVHVDRFTRLPFDEQISRVKGALDRYHSAEVKVDATGLGEPVLQQTRAAGVPARGVVLTAGKKTEIIRNLQVLLERGQVELPRREFAPELIDELEAYAYEGDGTGAGDHRRTSAPPGGHDDCVVAAALMCSFVVAGGAEGRACVNGVDRHLEREPERVPKTIEPPALAADVVAEHPDPEIAAMIRRAKEAAARKAKEAADHLKSIMGKHTPHGTDDEPRGGWTGTPRPQRSRFGFDLDLNI